MTETTISSGVTSTGTTPLVGDDDIEVYGTAVSYTLDNGGFADVYSGGSSISTTIIGLGRELVFNGGTANFTMLSSGGQIGVSAGGVVSNTTMNGGGALDYLYNGGTAVDSIVNSGGSENVFSGASASGSTVNSGGFENVYGTATNIDVQGGGRENVNNGGTATGTRIEYEGFEYVSGGGTTTDTTLEYAGSSFVSSGGTVVSTTVDGGTQVISVGATATGTLITSNGGAEYVYGSTTDATVNSTGLEAIGAGGFAIGTTLLNAGFEIVSAGGSAIDTTVDAGGNVYVSGGTIVSTTVSGGLAQDSIFSGGVASDTMVGAGAFEVVSNGGETTGTSVGGGGAYQQISAGGTAVSTTVGSGGEQAVYSGGSVTDTILDPGGDIDVTYLPFAGGGSAGLSPSTPDLLLVSVGGQTYTEQLSGDYSGEYFHLSEDPGGDTEITVDNTPCYCRGTCILTDHGEVPVEDLVVGDRIVTCSGEVVPILWIGRRAYSGRFIAGKRDVLPVRIHAGALANDQPRRDLWVSPLHAMFLDGVLVPAIELVNGVTIIQAEAVESVECFHVELDRHDVIWAEGVASETFVDDDSRMMFQNAHEYDALYPDAARLRALYCAPRLTHGYAMEAIRERLSVRAGVRETPKAKPLRGFLDFHDGDLVEGWAQNPEFPEAPVCLDILVDGVIRAQTLANRYRADLAAAGLGSGRHAFSVRLASFLPSRGDHVIEVRRSSDRTTLPASDQILTSHGAIIHEPGQADA